MIAYLNKNRGQSTLEYAILIIVILAALIAIQTYIKRGVQGRLKSASDDIGDQYSPGNTNSLTAEKRRSREQQIFGQARLTNGDLVYAQGLQTTRMVEAEQTNMVAKTSIVNNFREDWGN